jgi:predicted NACHT family NTPase
MNTLWSWVEIHTELAVAIFGIVAAMLGGLFTQIVWPALRAGFARVGAYVEERFSSTRFEREYLEWVINMHQFLPVLPTTLAPVAEHRKQELDKLYVSLSVSDRLDDPSATVPMYEVFSESHNIVILGDPGAGKTTFLRYIALTCSRARINATNLSGHISARTQLKQEFGFTSHPLPIFVFLNRFRDPGFWNNSKSMLDAIRDELASNDMLRHIPKTFFEDKLRNGECLFLLDAFDELGSQEARDTVATKIGELAAASPPGNRFLVSSRIVGYNGQLRSYGFDGYAIQRLSWESVKQLVGRWYAYLGETKLQEQLIGALQANPRLFDLAANPMLLSLIVLVQYVQRIIPDRRHVLYDECIKILVERRYAPPSIRMTFDKIISSDDAIRLLREIAQFMHISRVREIARNMLVEVVIPERMERLLITLPPLATYAEVLRNIEERSQLLVERGFNDRGEPVMAFSHLTFQEYLASVAFREAAAGAGEAAISTDLLERYAADPEWWEEVMLLYAAQLDGPERKHFLGRIQTLKTEPAPQ